MIDAFNDRKWRQGYVGDLVWSLSFINITDLRHGLISKGKCHYCKIKVNQDITLKNIGPENAVTAQSELRNNEFFQNSQTDMQS